MRAAVAPPLCDGASEQRRRRCGPGTGTGLVDHYGVSNADFVTALWCNLLCKRESQVPPSREQLAVLDAARVAVGMGRVNEWSDAGDGALVPNSGHTRNVELQT